jgi:hypothetical protein
MAITAKPFPNPGAAYDIFYRDAVAGGPGPVAAEATVSGAFVRLILEHGGGLVADQLAVGAPAATIPTLPAGASITGVGYQAFQLTPLEDDVTGDRDWRLFSDERDGQSFQVCLTDPSYAPGTDASSAAPAFEAFALGMGGTIYGKRLG